MPFVNVWIDDDECQCEGDCEVSQSQRTAIKTALTAIRDGRVSDAVYVLGEVCGDEHTRNQAAREKELGALLAAWRGLPAPRDDFLTYAHHKRKASLP